MLRGGRYRGRPVYFSDVVVRRDSRFHSFADLEGATWSYNEPLSHSGYGITRYRLVELGWTNGFFGRVVEAGFHDRSINLVRAGAVDASAIDCHVLALALRDEPGLAGDLRVIDSLGPSTIQPVAVASWLPETLKADLRAVLLEMGDNRTARRHLARGFVERFVAVSDASYDDLRQMRAACMAVAFLQLR